MNLIKVATMPDGSPEIFYSIQGEGPKMGRPSIFIRFSECNLYCKWCDTPYTWRWTDKYEHEDNRVFQKKDWQQEFALEEIARKIASFQCDRLIITGGEPLIHQKKLVALLDLLDSDIKEVEFETNGTVTPIESIDTKVTLYVVSPKLSNSGVAEAARLTQALDFFAKSNKAVFKFPTSSIDDFKEIQDIQSQYNIARDKIWILPCSRKSSELRLKGKELVEEILARGYSYSHRIHLDLFGDAQGT